MKFSPSLYIVGAFFSDTMKLFSYFLLSNSVRNFSNLIFVILAPFNLILHLIIILISDSNRSLHFSEFLPRGFCKVYRFQRKVFLEIYPILLWIGSCKCLSLEKRSGGIFLAKRFIIIYFYLL